MKKLFILTLLFVFAASADAHQNNVLRGDTIDIIIIDPDGTSEFVSEMQVGNNYYNHFNWGMNGDYNGYYLAGIFDVSEPRPISSLQPFILYPLETNFSSNVVMFYTYPNI